jgi:hypothetical protein
MYRALMMLLLSELASIIIVIILTFLHFTGNWGERERSTCAQHHLVLPLCEISILYLKFSASDS